MLHEKYFAYDKLEIPDKILRMSKEELDAEIERLEKEITLEKQKSVQSSVPIKKAV